MDELGHKVEKESPYVFVRQLQKTESGNKKLRKGKKTPLTSFCTGKKEKRDQVVGVHMMCERQGSRYKKYILYCLYPLHLGSLLQLVYPNLDD